MRKGMDYLQSAEELRKLATRMEGPKYKKQLERMAQEFETLAAERAKQPAKVASKRNALKSRREGS